MIQPWAQTGSEPRGDFRVFSVRSVSRRSPKTGANHEFFIIDSTNWVNVVAVTPDRRLVLVEQFRHGSGTVELELPGGMIDAKDQGPVEGAVRELREETGYAGERPRVIGSVFPNPAIMSNVCHTVLVENCARAGATQFDHAEDLETKLVPVDDIPDLVASGKIRHSLVVAALHHYDLWRRAQSAKI